MFSLLTGHVLRRLLGSTALFLFLLNFATAVTQHFIGESADCDEAVAQQEEVLSASLMNDLPPLDPDRIEVAVEAMEAEHAEVQEAMEARGVDPQIVVKAPPEPPQPTSSTRETERQRLEALRSAR